MSNPGSKRFAVDLLHQAMDLASKEKTRPRQASLRRAVSTSYYALFHLLIGDAVSLWKPTRQRAALAREFDHRNMRDASAKAAKTSLNGDVKTVGAAFVQLQQERHRADYDNSKVWTRLQAQAAISKSNEAFAAWNRASGTVPAQDFL